MHVACILLLLCAVFASTNNDVCEFIFIYLSKGCCWLLNSVARENVRLMSYQKEGWLRDVVMRLSASRLWSDMSHQVKIVEALGDYPVSSAPLPGTRACGEIATSSLSHISVTV